jgi:pyridoxamine 5'-phosphate oxidase
MTTTAAPVELATKNAIKIDNHEQYLSEGIPSAESLSPNPLTQFSQWFDQNPCPEPEAFALSSVSEQGIPSTRLVLLKRVDETGFVFFTNYESRKGKELGVQDGSEGGRYASMAFYWREQHRSVRVVGRVERISAEDTKEYYDGRPVGSRIGAWASPQSTVLTKGRQELQDRVIALEDKFIPKEGEEQKEIPVPSFWGGVRIVPFEVEFWMGRESRLHDRFRYTRSEGAKEDVAWDIVRLAP